MNYGKKSTAKKRTACYYLFEIGYSMQNYYCSGCYYSEYHYYSGNYYTIVNCCSTDCRYSSQCRSAVYHSIAAYYPVFRFLYQNYMDIHCPLSDCSVQEFLMCCHQSASCFPMYSPSCSDSTAVLPAIASYCSLHFPHQYQSRPSA